MSASLKVLLIFLLCFLFSAEAGAEEITGPEVSVKDMNITVSASLSLGEEGMNDLRNGISKEIVFYVDLFRHWTTWPDEFILGKVFTQTLRCDPVKKEYIASSFDGMTITEKRFSSCEHMARWALRIGEMRLTNSAELEQDRYFVKVTAESRLRRLPPVIGYLFFFVKEKEFSISKDSQFFEAGGRK